MPHSRSQMIREASVAPSQEGRPSADFQNNPPHSLEKSPAEVHTGRAETNICSELIMLQSSKERAAITKFSAVGT